MDGFDFDTYVPMENIGIDDVPAIYETVPENYQEGMEALQQSLDQFEQTGEATLNVPYDIIPQMIEDGLEPANENIVEFYPESEYADSPPDLPDLSDLQNEADMLDIEPLDEPPPPEPLDETAIDYDAVFDGLDSYDFDGIDIKQNCEQLDGLLDGFCEDNWSNLDLAGQKEQISGLFDYVNESLGLENPPLIEYYQGDVGEYGGFDPETNTLSINENMLYESDEAADTVAHELWHAYQHERAGNPCSPKDYLYQAGFDNYIRPGDDFDAYQSQLIEAEARAFADQIKGRVRI